ncbi:ArsR/SmtB family transcription factor [Microbulbifer halophilus]|uniref:ArsR/SmtB family transcription factor n=1 Tax=Microbulbifer halophilus TaxID=453963 RepID=UPI00361FAC40
MVESELAQLNDVFHALGDTTRRRMLRELSEGEKTVGELAAPFEMSLAAASKHIKVLEKAGLIRARRAGVAASATWNPVPWPARSSG